MESLDNIRSHFSPDELRFYNFLKDVRFCGKKNSEEYANLCLLELLGKTETDLTGLLAIGRESLQKQRQKIYIILFPIRHFLRSSIKKIIRTIFPDSVKSEYLDYTPEFPPETPLKSSSKYSFKFSSIYKLTFLKNYSFKKSIGKYYKNQKPYTKLTRIIKIVFIFFAAGSIVYFFGIKKTVNTAHPVVKISPAVAQVKYPVYMRSTNTLLFDFVKSDSGGVIQGHYYKVDPVRDDASEGVRLSAKKIPMSLECDFRQAKLTNVIGFILLMKTFGGNVLSIDLDQRHFADKPIGGNATDCVIQISGTGTAEIDNISFKVTETNDLDLYQLYVKQKY